MARKKRTSDDEPSFEAALAQLEEIVAALELGDLGLADALARYEQGVAHLKTCYKLLESAERKVELLAGVDAEGNATTIPFDEDAAASLPEKAGRRSRRRSRPAAASDDSDSGSDSGDDSGDEVDDEADDVDEGRSLF